MNQDGPHNLPSAARGSVETLYARIQQNADAIRALLPLPHLPAFELIVQQRTPKAVLGDPIAKSELALAVQSLDEARQKVARHAELTAQQSALQQEKNAFEHSQRMAQIEVANRQLASAEQEYMAAGLALCRAYRRLLTQSRRNHLVPGSKTNLPRGFDFQPAIPMGWQGTAAEIMQQGPLPFEAREDRDEAAA